MFKPVNKLQLKTASNKFEEDFFFFFFFLVLERQAQAGKQGIK